MYCNTRTYKQRKKLIDARPVGGKDYWAYSAEFDKVSYHEHLRALERFKNPAKLYGPLNRAILEGERNVEER